MDVLTRRGRTSVKGMTLARLKTSTRVEGRRLSVEERESGMGKGAGGCSKFQDSYVF